MVKIIMCEQCSLDWHEARRGIPTASEAAKIITPSRGKPAAEASKYAYQLLAERLLNATGTTLDGLPYLERGRACEPEAVAEYEFENGCKLLPVGIMLSDCGRYGASPDRLIADKRAAVEVKSPSAATHIQYLVEGKLPAAYTPQVMMQILVGDLDYADFYSYHPRCPAFRLRTYRDEAYLAKLKDALDAFCDNLDAMEAKARATGMWMPYARLAMPTDASMTDAVEGDHAAEFMSGAPDAGEPPLRVSRYAPEDYLSA